MSMVLAATSQIMLKGVLREVEPLGLSWSAWQSMLAPERSIRAGAAMLMIGVGFLSWVMCLARLELSYAYPIACSSILLVALFSAVFLGESITLKMWLGSALIVVGVILLMPQR
jgi:drug/metabolite transporter (DMT)-like permease